MEHVDAASGGGEAALAGLRSSESTESHPHVGYRGGGYRGAGTEYTQKFLRVRLPPFKEQFETIYHSFLRAVVLPDIGDPKGILFQRTPTFRCHVAGGGAPTGVKHNDHQYGHSSYEINYWLPVTRAHGTNSLCCESKPGLGDFEPFECSHGELVRFWGSQCVHYTQANEEDVTRVSMDFRVMPRSCYDAEERAHCHLPGEGKFVLGAFFGALDADGRVSFEKAASDSNRVSDESVQPRSRDVQGSWRSQ